MDVCVCVVSSRRAASVHWHKNHKVVLLVCESALKVDARLGVLDDDDLKLPCWHRGVVDADAANREVDRRRRNRRQRRAWWRVRRRDSRWRSKGRARRWWRERWCRGLSGRRKGRVRMEADAEDVEAVDAWVVEAAVRVAAGGADKAAARRGRRLGDVDVCVANAVELDVGRVAEGQRERSERALDRVGLQVEDGRRRRRVRRGRRSQRRDAVEAPVGGRCAVVEDGVPLVELHGVPGGVVGVANVRVHKPPSHGRKRLVAVVDEVEWNVNRAVEDDVRGAQGWECVGVEDGPFVRVERVDALRVDVDGAEGRVEERALDEAALGVGLPVTGGAVGERRLAVDDRRGRRGRGCADRI